MFRDFFMTTYQGQSIGYVFWDTDDKKNTGKKSIIPIILFNIQYTETVRLC